MGTRSRIKTHFKTQPMKPSKNRTNKYGYHKIEVGESFTVDFRGFRPGIMPSNYETIRQAWLRANKSGRTFSWDAKPLYVVITRLT